MTADADRPAMFRVESGHPTSEELAALTVVIAARQAAAAAVGPAAPAATRSAWADPLRLVRPPLHPGRGRWRTQAFPR